MSDCNDRLESIVKDTADQIEAAANGALYDIGCARIVIDDLDAWKLSNWERMREDFILAHPGIDTESEAFADALAEEIGAACPDDIDDPYRVTLHELLSEDSLGDVRFEVNQHGDLFGGKIVVAHGGPNVWVADDEVRGYWGGKKSRRSLTADTRWKVFEWFEEQWACARQEF